MSARTQVKFVAKSTDRKELIEAIEALSEGFALFDEDDSLIFCNSTFLRLTEPASNILEEGLPWTMFEQALHWRGVYTEIAVKRLASALTSLFEIDDSIIGIELDRGDYGWHQASLQPTDSGGFVITLKDISEQKILAERQREAESLLRRMFDASPTNLIISDLDANEYLHWTPAWEALLGAPNRNKQWTNPSDQADLLADLLATGEVNDFETQLVDRSGRAFPARISARLTEHNGHKVSVSAVQDMTTVDAQRNEITRINQRLLDAIAALDQGFALFDADDKLVVFNDLYKSVNEPVVSLLRPGASNKALVDAAILAQHEPAAVGWPDRADSGLAVPRRREEFNLPDGREFQATRMPTSDGGFVLVWLDVSEQRKAEQELARQRERSFQNEKLSALGELLAGVAHELNNPLSVVVGHALMLREDVEEPNLARRIDKISDSAERCSKIVKTFLAMARQRPVKLESISINTLVETALDVCDLGMRSSGASVEKRLATNLPLVQADEDQLTQVIVNLLTNAEHAIADNGEDGLIRIETLHDAKRDAILVRISDDGPGIPEHLQARIFEPFFTTKTVGKGTGVGLALCHRIVETHGGSLDLHSLPGKGATFTIQLQVARKEAGAAAETGHESTRGLRALIIEDESDVADMIAEMLNAMDIDVKVASSAEEGLEHINTDRAYDFILSDLKMPGLGGYGLLETLKLRRPDMLSRLAFVTGDAMSPDAEEIRNSAANPLIEKPVSPKELRRLVGLLLGPRNE